MLTVFKKLYERFFNKSVRKIKLTDLSDKQFRTMSYTNIVSLIQDEIDIAFANGEDSVDIPFDLNQDIIDYFDQNYYSFSKHTVYDFTECEDHIDIITMRRYREKPKEKIYTKIYW